MALNLPVDMQCDLFDKLIVPIALYGCEVWGLKYMETIEQFHRKFLKQLLKVSKYSANCMVYGELGRQKLQHVIQKRLVNFWLHLKFDNQRKLSSVLYNLMLKMNDTASTTNPWISNVKDTLDLAGFSNCWSADELDHRWLLKALDRRMKDIDLQHWHSEVNTNSLCVFYRIVKEHNEIEPYLTSLRYKSRISLTKFKFGANNLLNSISRRDQTDQVAICSLCQAGNLGDEYHYVMECAYFYDMRKKLIPEYFWTCPNSYKIKELF